MDDKAVRARREYYKKWRRDNPDKVKAHQQRYWERVAERMAADASQQK